MKNNINILLAILCCFLFSCSNETPNDTPNLTGNLRAIVVNEGQFGYGTSSLTTLTEDGTIQQDVFRRINNRPMGDVAQSLTRIGDYYYVPLNNSRKVEVFESKTYRSVETMSIDLDVIPMYLTHLGGDSVAVTDQKMKSKLMIMDINHNTNRKFVRRHIDLGGRSFQMQLLNSKLFVGGDRLLVFDLKNLTDEGMRSIKRKDGSDIQTVDFSKVIIDKNNRLWVLGHHQVICIDPNTEQTVFELEVGHLNINTWVSCIDISPDHSTIYFNSARKVYSINVENPIAPTKPILNVDRNDQRTVYNMSVSKQNTIFFCEVLYGSISRAEIYEYEPLSGKEINRFKAGIFPHYIHFE